MGSFRHCLIDLRDSQLPRWQQSRRRQNGGRKKRKRRKNEKEWQYQSWVSILEEKSVWGTDAPTKIAYMDTQDIARLTFIALRNDNINGKLLTFADPRAWTTQEVITLCERLAGQDSNRLIIFSV